MRISIIGTGYVGLVTGACFSEMGNEVICVDIDKNKIEKLKKGKIPIYEPNLEYLVKENYKKKNLYFTNNIKEAIKLSELCFIAVGTPTNKDGSTNLNYVYEVAKSIGKFIDKDMYIISKSTVPVGTSENIKKIIKKKIKERKEKIDFEMISNPEFLKEGDAINDFMKPDRIIIGVESKRALDKMSELYSPFISINKKRLVLMDIRSAEMTKYTANAMLATKISFMNEMSNICEKLGANINKVREGIGSDNRIGYSFIYAGCGYGGSCFPKDIKALINMGENNNYTPKILKAVEMVNKEQKIVLVKKILKQFNNNIKNKTFSIWGLSFKPGTNDIREASSLTIIKELIKNGAKIKVYDPKAMDEMKKYIKENIQYCDSKYKALKDSEALILLTEWKEFRSPNFKKIKKLLKKAIIFDGRNQYHHIDLKKDGFCYHQIGVKTNA